MPPPGRRAVAKSAPDSAPPAQLTLAALLDDQADVRRLVLREAAVSLRALASLRRVAKCWRDWVDGWAATALPQLCVLGGGRPPSDAELAAAAADNGGSTLSTITVLSCVHTFNPASMICAPRAGWRKLPDLHAPRCAAAVCGLPDGRIFVAGGMDQELEPLRDAFIYDPTGRTPGGHMNIFCRAIAPVPVAVSGARAALLDDHRVLVVGGDSVLSQSTDDVAAAEASMMLPTAMQMQQHAAGQAAAADEEEDEDDDDDDDGGQPTTLCDANIYDLETGEWTSCPPMQNARAHFAIGSLSDGRIIVAGGLCSITEEVTTLEIDPMGGPHQEETLRAHGSAPLAEVEVYDPDCDRWDNCPPLPHGPRAGCCGAVLRGDTLPAAAAADKPEDDPWRGRDCSVSSEVFVVIGGDGEDGNLCRETEALDMGMRMRMRGHYPADARRPPGHHPILHA